MIILSGIISNKNLTGDYRNNFTNTSELSFDYTYDKSNRLLKQDNKPGDELNYDLFNTYDKDGNHLTMQRYGDGSSLLDNFSYEYYSGTNRLKNVSNQSFDKYAYDFNGNDTMDFLNSNTYMKYDYRNLLIECSNNASLSYTLWTRYYYDEAGNRIRKYVLRADFGNAPPPENWNNLDTGWSVESNQYYVRDVNGKEIAIYNDTVLTQWNVYGLSNEGRINSNRSRNFYLKDHLGSVRVMLDENRNVVSSQDYDCWGYLLEDRVYQIENSKYKFTGKERDWESLGYDYFGARYYMSRIANWSSIDPLFDKHFGWTPYNYVLRNPLRLVDPEGKQIDAVIEKFVETTTKVLAPEIYIGTGIVGLIISTTLVPTELNKDEQIFIDEQERLRNQISKEQVIIEDNISINRLETKGGKQRIKETELEGVKTKEIYEKLENAKRDKNKKETRRLIKELKARGERDIQKDIRPSRKEYREDPNN
jgi:RHS repeat-associated protein